MTTTEATAAYCQANGHPAPVPGGNNYDRGWLRIVRRGATDLLVGTSSGLVYLDAGRGRRGGRIGEIRHMVAELAA